MKVFRKEETAEQSELTKDTFFLNSICPYQAERMFCGNWCALFYFYQGVKSEHENTSSHVILGCKAGEKILYVEKLVEG